MFNIKINNKQIKARKGETILQAAQRNKINIPTLCYHSDLPAKASCRVCVVEIKGHKNPEPACSTKVKDGMEITTHSPALKQLRKINLELLFAQHKEECDDCVYGFNCAFRKLAQEYGVEINRFRDRKTNFPVHQFGPALLFDSSKCIDCGNCIEVCKQQKVNYLIKEEKETFNQIAPNPNRECIFCGQCLVHCPVGAFEAVGEFEEIEKPLRQAGKTVVFQFAPSIRATIGEEFDMKPGKIVTEKLVAAIKKLGADYVFDVSVGADFTTTEEALELMHKIEKGECATLFSSCCPAWVRFVELYYPGFVKNIATARPPHIILGGLIKTYWAKNLNTAPENIVVVSVMPCVAKKYEITRKELLINWQGKTIKPVDYVLTTRELAHLFYKNEINLNKIKGLKADAPLGMPSGGGVIYGASGGVMESALRSAYSRLNKGKRKRLEFKKVRGQKGIKISEIKFGKKKMKMAAVSGTGNAAKVLEQLRKNPKAYDCVEVMACPGGCIGGGGQTMPADKKIRKARADALYKIDKKQKQRIAHLNPIVKKVYKEFLTNDEIIKAVCHAKYY